MSAPIHVRTAQPTDDLSVLWPALGTRKLNLQQVWVAVAPDLALLGGALVIDGGHEIVYFGELSIVARSRQALITKRILQNALLALAQQGRTTVIFHTVNPEFLAMAVKLGATPMGPRQFVVLSLARSETP